MISSSVVVGPSVSRSEAVILNTGKRDHSVRLTCDVSGSPSPVLAWYRGESLVQSSARHVVTREDVGGHVSRHVLSLLGVSDADYGNYSCLATNTVGSDRSVDDFLKKLECLVLALSVDNISADPDPSQSQY